MTEQNSIPSSDIANADPSTTDVNALRYVRKAPGVHTKHEGLLRPPMIAVYINGDDEPLYLKIAESAILGRKTFPEPQSSLIELGTLSLEQGVSRQHARINWQNGGLLIEDLGSSNGTFVNQMQLTPHFPKRLSSGDVVELGQMMLEIYFASEPPGEAVAPADQMPRTHLISDSSQPVVESSPLLLPAATEPAEYVATARLTKGHIFVEDLLHNNAGQIEPNGDITLKLKQDAESRSTLVLEIALTDPSVQKIIQNMLSDKPALEMTELKMWIVRHLG